MSIQVFDSKGKLIVLEGIDGVGKTTQCYYLIDFLKRRNYIPCYFKEPSKSIFGQKIRNLITKKKRLLPQEEYEFFLKDRQDNVQRNIIPNLKKGKIVVLDRYYFSSMAYQGVFDGFDALRIQEENERFARIPDIVFIIDCPVDIALERIKKDIHRKKEDLFEKREYLEKVRMIFQKLKAPYIFHIDGRYHSKEVFKSIDGVVEKRIFETA